MKLSSDDLKSAASVVKEMNRLIDPVHENQPGSREVLLALSQRLTAMLETPSETIQRIGWAEPARFVAIRIAADLKVFDALKEADGDSVNTSQLASQAGAENSLIARTMKHLSAINVVCETSADEFSSTRFSNALTIPKYRDGISYWFASDIPLLLHVVLTHRSFDVAGPSFRGMPKFLKDTKYQNPGNIADGPFQYAHHTTEPFFVWLGERPEHFEHFNNYMSGYRQGKRSWMDEGFYPVKERLGHDTQKDDKNAVFLVDVGGGLGHDLEELKLKCLSIRGRLVLQDQPEIIAQIDKASHGIELTTHDFFTPQPVKGARAYYMHSVLHDWDDASSLKILQNIVPAMQPGYSKLLINENVVPDVGATWSITSMDWLMMALGAVRERTEKQWRDLLGQAGLKVTGVWTYEQGTESLIEAERDI